MSHQRSITWGMALVLLCGAGSTLEAQIGTRLRDAAARAAEREATRQIDRKVTETVRCVFDDLECIRRAERDGRKVETTDRNGNPTDQAAGTAVSTSPNTDRPGDTAPAAPGREAARTATQLRFVQVRSAPAAWNSCGLTEAGDLYCWGAAENGPRSEVPVRVSATEHLRLSSFDMSFLGTTGCGLTQDGSAYCWGSAYEMVLSGMPPDRGGMPGRGIQNRAVPVQGGHRFTHLSMQVFHACALTGTGAAYCWHIDTSPPGYRVLLGDGRGARGEDGRLSAVPVRVAGSVRFQQIAVGMWHSCGLAADGQVHCWGSRDYARQAAVPRPLPGAPRFTSIFGANESVCGITAEGLLHCWTISSPAETCWVSWEGIDIRCSPTPKPVSVPGGFRVASGGADHVCGVSSAGSTYCWGYRVGEHLAAPPTDQCFYHKDSQQYEELRRARPGSAALQRLEELRVSCSMRPLSIPGAEGLSQIAVGMWHTCGLTAEGTAICWGYNGSGQLGRGSRGDVYLPPASIASPR